MKVKPPVIVVFEGWEHDQPSLVMIERARRLGVSVYHGTDALLAGLYGDESVLKTLTRLERRFWKKKKRT